MIYQIHETIKKICFPVLQKASDETIVFSGQPFSQNNHALDFTSHTYSIFYFLFLRRLFKSNQTIVFLDNLLYRKTKNELLQFHTAIILQAQKYTEYKRQHEHKLSLL